MSSVDEMTKGGLPGWTQLKTPAGTRRVRTDNNQFGADALEAGRLEMQHGLLKMALRRIYFSPLSHPTPHVLDIGFGVGVWTLEFLEQFPQGHCTTLDIDTVLFKRFLQKPLAKNLLKRRQECGYPPLERCMSYIQADATKHLPFDDATFDFTYAGLPDTFLSDQGWAHLIREMLRVTKPDGWAEILYAGHFYSEQPSEIISTMLERQIQLCLAVGIAPTGEPKMDSYLKEAGVQTFQRRQHLLGRNPKERQMVARDIRLIIESSRPGIMAFGIMPTEQFDAYNEQFEAEAMRTGFWMPFYSLWFRPQDQFVGEQASQRSV